MYTFVIDFTSNVLEYVQTKWQIHIKEKLTQLQINYINNKIYFENILLNLSHAVISTYFKRQRTYNSYRNSTVAVLEKTWEKIVKYSIYASRITRMCRRTTKLQTALGTTPVIKSQNNTYLTIKAARIYLCVL